MLVTRTELQNAEEAIRSRIQTMGREAVQALNDTAMAMDRQDAEHAARIVENDAHFNELYLEIHDACMTAIARHQPVATDLREMLSNLQIAIELERIADHIASMAQIVSQIKAEGIPPVWSEILNMIKLGTVMMEKILTACYERDHDAAAVICAGDEDIDRMNDQVVREIIKFMGVNKSAITNGTLMIWMVHHVERICDRITNIGEQILFTKTGKLVDMNLPGRN